MEWGKRWHSKLADHAREISQLTQQYADVVDGAIVAEPLVASVNVTVGPNQGIQSLVFVATQHDSLYAFNVTTGQLAWHTSFLIPGATALPPSELDFQGSGIIGTPVIDPATNTIYLVSSESYAAGDVTHYMKTLHAIDMSDGAEGPGSPTVIADTGYVGNKAVSFAGPSVRGTGRRQRSRAGALQRASRDATPWADDRRQQLGDCLWISVRVQALLPRLAPGL